MSRNIAIISTVINFELYNKTAVLYPRDIQKYVIDGRNGMHGIDTLLYMHKKLKGKDIEWLIMADEDVVFVDSELVHNCISKMEAEQMTVCGVRDGGIIPHRTFNPYAINTFFSIINFKEICAIWDEKKMLKNQYAEEFNDDLSSLLGIYDVNSLFEPYYCFYLWLRRENKKFLYLDADVPFEEDKFTNLIKDSSGNDMLYHTWHARSYNVVERQTVRINNVLNKVGINAEEFVEPIVFKDKTYGIRRIFKKTARRVLRRIHALKSKEK